MVYRKKLTLKSWPIVAEAAGQAEDCSSCPPSDPVPHDTWEPEAEAPSMGTTSQHEPF